MIEIEQMKEAEIPELAPLVAQFRVTLKAFKGITASPNENEGASELQEYLDAGFPVYTARKADKVCGYFVELTAGPGAVRKTLHKYVNE